MNGRKPRAGHWPPRKPVIAFAILIAVLIVSVVLFDWNWLKGPVERRVSAATGREFAIDGDLDVDVGRIVHVRAARVRLGNAAWAAERQMLRIENADVGIALWPLLRGEVLFPVIRLDRPRLLLERNASGEANWTFGARDKEPSALPDLPRVDRLTVREGEFELVEPRFRTRLHVNVRSAAPGSQDAAPPLLIDGSGRFRDGEFEVRGRIDSPLQLLERQEPYRIELRARAGRTQAHARGALRSSVQLQDFDVDFRLAGTDLAELYDLIGVVLPETPPYELDGRLSRVGDTWRYRDFEGRVGDSDVSGDVSVELGGERPRMRGELVSQRLDSTIWRAQSAARHKPERGRVHRPSNASAPPAMRTMRPSCPNARSISPGCAPWTRTSACGRSASTRPSCRWSRWRPA